MVTLNTLKLYLKDLKYPGFDLMPDEEVPNIFGKGNRLNFLTWFMKNWHPDITFPMDDKKNDMLVELLYDNGFCSHKNSTKFVYDNLELPPGEQVLIFNRMLYNLKMLQSEKEMSSPCEVTYLTQMEIFGKLDLNIFPSYGPIKCRTLKEQIEKLKEYDDKIFKLAGEIEILNTEDDLNFEIDRNDALSFDNIDLKQEIPMLMDMFAFEKENTKDNKAEFSDNFTNVTGACNTKILAVLKLYENKKSINEFNGQRKAVKYEDSKDIYIKIQDLAKFSEEILNFNEVS